MLIVLTVGSFVVVRQSLQDMMGQALPLPVRAVFSSNELQLVGDEFSWEINLDGIKGFINKLEQRMIQK